MQTATVRKQLAARAIRIAAHQQKQRNRKARSPSPKLIAVPANPVRSTRASRNEAHRQKMAARCPGPSRPAPTIRLNYSDHPKGQPRTTAPRRSIWPATRAEQPA